MLNSYAEQLILTSMAGLSYFTIISNIKSTNVFTSERVIVV